MPHWLSTGFFPEDSNQIRPQGFYGSLGNFLQGGLHVRLQLACDRKSSRVGETLVSTKFRSTTTRGFTNPDNPMVAVCLRPGTEIAFETDVRTGGCLFGRNFRARLADAGIGDAIH